ncbi:MAG TPA: SdrD B-like domain-containing protein, partial [Chloroflexota bacterium]|nr:SdrD B-like domain-containing protein [Chloroflexota bacterium]
MGDVELLTAPAPIEVGNRVWQDDDGNGIQDPGEPPIAGINVELYDNTGTLAATTTTDVNGLYYFTNLQYRVGYQVRVDLNQLTLDGMSVSPPQADGAAFGEIRDSDGQPRLGGYVAIDFTTGGPGENNHTYDFGFAPLVSLGDFIWDDEDKDGYYDGPVQVGDYVWYDRNGNGVQNAGEPGVGGIGVALHRSTDTACADPALAQTSTGPDGRYLFTDLPPGNYFVCFTLADLPAGFTVTQPGQGGDPALDSDANQTTGQTGNTGALASGQQNLNLDMGIVHPAGSVSVGDKVWYDVDGNGRQDANEPGVPGVTVDLFTAGQVCADTPVATQTTDESGNYLFTGLGAGNYFVCFNLTTIPAGYSLTAANNQADDSVDSDADANGQTPPTGNLNAGQFDFTLDMGIVSAGNVSVGDYVWYDDNGNGLQDAGEGGVPGIRVQLFADGQDCVTDTPLMVTITGGDGSYLFTGLPSGSYFVCFDVNNLPTGFEVTAQDAGADDQDSDADPTTGATAATGIIPANSSDLTLDMGIRQIAAGTVSVGDRVWYDDDRNGVQDPGEAGVPGVTVALHLATDT